MSKVIIVENDIKSLKSIKEYLESHNLVVATACNGLEAVRLLKNEDPYLVLLNITLPDIHGFEVCKIIRETSSVPIVFLADQFDSKLIQRGFEIGGDDVVLKPFNVDILIGRIKAFIRRYYNEIKRSVLKYNKLEIDPTSCTVYYSGQPISLIAKELQILMYLAQHPNQVFSAEQLYRNIWGIESLGDARTVMVHISNLRKKIEEDSTKPIYIQTVRGFGYKFSVPKNELIS